MRARFFDCSDIPGTTGYCDEAARAAIMERLDAGGFRPSGVRLFGSGNYHYLSLFFLQRMKEPFALILIDHHPDMRAPSFGEILSCGGWVREALHTLPLLRQVIIIGAEPALFAEEYEALLAEAAEEAAHPLVKSAPGRVRLSGGGEELSSLLRDAALSLYLSVDKDVLSETELKTDWDQGDMTLDALTALLRGLWETGRVIGCDICGAGDAPRDAAVNEALCGALYACKKDGSGV